MRYHLFQKFFGKMVKIKKTSFLYTRGMGLMFGNCMYSLRPKLWTKYCFMKQNCQLQSGIAQYENAATPVSSKAIHATH